MANDQSMPVDAAGAHGSHPGPLDLMPLVFSAILQVVCTSLPGYILARMGLLSPKYQKFLSELGLNVFTPALVFSKLGSQMSLDKLQVLWVIPVMFTIQTFVSWLAALVVSCVLGLERRPRNFVTAMAVFGNSNSLPISLVVSLSHTISGLHWLPNDSDGAVAGRGILYLLIFQQLGQVVRWTWGYRNLLRPKNKYPEYRDVLTEEGSAQVERYTDDVGDDNAQENSAGGGSGETTPGGNAQGDDLDHYSPAGRTPVHGSSGGSPADTDDEADGLHKPRKNSTQSSEPSAEGVCFPHTANPHSSPEHFVVTFKAAWMRKVDTAKTRTRRAGHQLYDRLPRPLQRALDYIEEWGSMFFHDFMNPPLWAMVFAMLVASVPKLKEIFFGGGFVNNSVTTAIKSMGEVAVPLILVVLGANLNNRTQDVQSHDQEEAKLGKRLLWGSLVARLLLPPLLMGPVIALFVKLVPVSILGDPIFTIVSFLLVGAPSALQLAQICQLNEVYEGVMAKILFWSYVVWILPSTMVLVMTALETVEWAAR